MSKQEAIEHLIEQLLEGDGFRAGGLLYTLEDDVLTDLHDGVAYRDRYHAIMAKLALGRTNTFKDESAKLWRLMHESAKTIAENLVDDWLEEQKADNELQKAGV